MIGNASAEVTRVLGGMLPRKNYLTLLEWKYIEIVNPTITTVCCTILLIHFFLRTSKILTRLDVFIFFQQFEAQNVTLFLTDIY